MPVRARRKDTVVFIVGPTGTGKTCLAIRLAKRLSSEIVSSDSMQVYRGMGILTQAPTRSDRNAVKHHLVSYVNPSIDYSVADYRDRAVKAIRSIVKRGKVPIVTGGSGLYVKALIDGLFPSPKEDPALRKKLKAYSDKYGKKRLYSRLLTIDPKSALRIHPNDTRRVIRALEIYHNTGKTMTELKAETKGIGDEFRVRIYGLVRPRDQMYSMIDKRVVMMYKAGLVGEVRRLSKGRLSRNAKAALGIREILEYINGNINIDDALDLIAMNTRRFAKRQLTWFRADKRIKWFDLSKLSEADIVRRIVKKLG